MTDNVENLVLEHLRRLRNGIQGTRMEMQSEFREPKRGWKS
ncbi:hypothetical protein SAMN02949497_3598 [Methylomagnum ishizawai]|uniref:Uncharacterized protein n=1 Tax=Methylomagnum ishizawai TaxID=1760988 RepID=A0A1Y6CZU5_9GAMM|nr:hypothetical protein SAMN02949497_3598 [Methylomagnum ishizawai]